MYTAIHVMHNMSKLRYQLVSLYLSARVHLGSPFSDWNGNSVYTLCLSAEDCAELLLTCRNLKKCTGQAICNINCISHQKLSMDLKVEVSRRVFMYSSETSLRAILQ